MLSITSQSTLMYISNIISSIEIYWDTSYDINPAILIDVGWYIIDTDDIDTKRYWPISIAIKILNHGFKYGLIQCGTDIVDTTRHEWNDLDIAGAIENGQHYHVIDSNFKNLMAENKMETSNLRF